MLGSARTTAPRSPYGEGDPTSARQGDTKPKGVKTGVEADDGAETRDERGHEAGILAGHSRYRGCSTLLHDGSQDRMQARLLLLCIHHWVYTLAGHLPCSLPCAPPRPLSFLMRRQLQLAAAPAKHSHVLDRTAPRSPSHDMSARKSGG